MTERRAVSGRSPGPLSVVDTLTGRRKSVTPPSGRTVNLYVCGPTVYAPAHVGHARTYLYFDVARRSLEASGARVRHVMNVTDVEDKIDARAKALGVSSVRLARLEEARFFRDLGALGVLPPHVRPRAGDFVPEMVAIGRRLERTGRVRHEGDEWFYEPPEHRRGENFPTGSELARHAVEEPGHPFLSSGRDRAILVWKRQDAPRRHWPSPWGRGVPGWHLECFAMATKHLGVPVDLHGGARDLVYPHHFSENEIALALGGTPFSRVFLHTGFVLQNGAKMSKSVGNLVTLRTALDDVDAGALRWYLLGTGYADRLPWEPRELRRAAEQFAVVRRRLAEAVAPGGGGSLAAATVVRAARRVAGALAHGLDTPAAESVLVELAGELGRHRAPTTRRGERREALQALADVERRTGWPLVPR